MSYESRLTDRVDASDSRASYVGEADNISIMTERNRAGYVSYGSDSMLRECFSSAGLDIPKTVLAQATKVIW